MEGIFQIRHELGVFWRTPTTIQVGLEASTAVVIEGLEPNEHSFISALTRPHTTTELEDRARRMRISSARARKIVDMLEKAKVLTNPDNDMYPQGCVFIPRLDHLGAAVAFGLASAGISITSNDETSLTHSDHPLLLIHGRSGNRANSLIGALRAQFPLASTSGPIALSFVSGSRLIDPSFTGNLCAEGKAHLLAWVEEAEIRVGPLVLPRSYACAQCLYYTRIRKEKEWVNLAPQAVLTPPIIPLPSERDVAAALAVRAIRDFLLGKESLEGKQWRIPYGKVPFLIRIPTDPSCGCTEESILTFHNTSKNKENQ